MNEPMYYKFIIMYNNFENMERVKVVLERAVPKHISLGAQNDIFSTNLRRDDAKYAPQTPLLYRNLAH